MNAVSKDSYYQTDVGGLYVIMLDGSACKVGDPGAYWIAAEDVEDRVARGEWQQIVSPKISQS